MGSDLTFAIADNITRPLAVGLHWAQERPSALIGPARLFPQLGSPGPAHLRFRIQTLLLGIWKTNKRVDIDISALFKRTNTYIN